MSQSERIKQMTDEELTKSIVLSQILLLLLSIILSLFFFDQFVDWFKLFQFDPWELFYYGIIPGLVIVIIDITIIKIFPKKFFDDGGINERIFKNRSIGSIFFLSILIAISEELLFRGVIQTTFGLFFASIIFALAHFRYIKKPLLLTVVIIVSFYLGYLYMITENLLVTICAHFIVDFMLGLIIRYKK